MKCTIIHYWEPDPSNVIYREEVEVVPVCGEDYCERCGDCLACYGEDACFVADDHEHWLVRYQGHHNSEPEGVA